MRNAVERCLVPSRVSQSFIHDTFPVHFLRYWTTDWRGERLPGKKVFYLLLFIRRKYQKNDKYFYTDFCRTMFGVVHFNILENSSLMKKYFEEAHFPHGHRIHMFRPLAGGKLRRVFLRCQWFSSNNRFSLNGRKIVSKFSWNLQQPFQNH